MWFHSHGVTGSWSLSEVSRLQGHKFIGSQVHGSQGFWSQGHEIAGPAASKLQGYKIVLSQHHEGMRQQGHVRLLGYEVTRPYDHEVLRSQGNEIAESWGHKIRDSQGRKDKKPWGHEVTVSYVHEVTQSSFFFLPLVTFKIQKQQKEYC